MTFAAFADLAHAWPWFFPAVAGVLGACIGSFLNVVIYRVPAGQSVVHPGSHCACGQPIAWYDNIPIVSWFVLRGRARCCGRAYAFRYAFVEALTGLLFLACAAEFTPGTAVCGMIFLSLLTAAFFIDLDHFIIPDGLTLGGAVFAVLLSMAVPALHHQHSGIFALDSARSLIASLQGLLIGSGLVLWIALLAEALLKKEAMGFGDVKFLGLIGAFCGWQGAVFSIFGGALVGTVWVSLALIWQKLGGRQAAPALKAESASGEPAALGFGARVPFGPMLAIAAAIYFLAAERWVSAWFSDVIQLF